MDKVVSISMTHVIGGVGIARVGDMVICPPGRGASAAVEGVATYVIGERIDTLHGHKTACARSPISALTTTATHGPP